MGTDKGVLGGLSLVEPKTNVKSMLSSKNFRPYIYKYGEVVSIFGSTLKKLSIELREGKLMKEEFRFIG